MITLSRNYQYLNIYTVPQTITYSVLWLVNILLHKFDTWKWQKHNFFNEKQTKNAKKVYVKSNILTVHSPHWLVMKHAQNFRDTEKIYIGDEK